MDRSASRNYSRIATDAVLLMGQMIRASRIERGIRATELAAHAGVSLGPLSRVETGDMGFAIGAVFEIAAVLGSPLFKVASERLETSLAHQRRVDAVFPSRVFHRA